MAKVTAPLLSFGARGQIGKAQVYATWRGVDYARRHVVPANPRTTAQMLTRDTWRLLSTLWVIAPPELTAPWNLLAQGRKFTGQNRFMGDNLRELREDEGLDNFIASPGVRSGFPLTSVTASTGSAEGEIDVVPGMPGIPPEWSIERVIYIAIKDQAPNELFSGLIHVHTEDEATYSGTITGLDAEADYVISAYIEWTKPDGKTAYGRSTNDTAAAAAA